MYNECTKGRRENEFPFKEEKELSCKTRVDHEMNLDDKWKILIKSKTLQM